MTSRLRSGDAGVARERLQPSGGFATIPRHGEVGMMPGAIHLLLVDSDPAFAGSLAALCVRVHAPRLELIVAREGAEAQQQLSEGGIDVILLGHSCSPRPSLSAFAQLQKAAPAVPIILLIEPGDDDTSLLGVREGAEDYLVKGEFDGRALARVARYAIERKRVENRLRESEGFFRLISESMTDLVAVLDQDGRRLYNSPSYERSLGHVTDLAGTNSFREIHPDDVERIQSIFRQTLATGAGQRADYRMLLADGTVRHIESQGSVIRDEHGQPSKVVVVGRDITERKQAMQDLERALSELRETHEALQAAQARLVQSEKIEALSTFAAGIAHEVRNPLQTILLGVDFLKESVKDLAGTASGAITVVLADLENAARRADAVIQGLLEFTAYREQDIQDHDLSQLADHALRAVEAELSQHPIKTVRDWTPALPTIRVDRRKIRHVLIKLLLAAVEPLRSGGTLTVRTRPQAGASGLTSAAERLGPGRGVSRWVVVEVERCPTTPTRPPASASPADEPGLGLIRQDELDLMVMRKVVELYGGMVQTGEGPPGCSRVTLLFRAQSPPTS